MKKIMCFVLSVIIMLSFNINSSVIAASLNTDTPVIRSNGMTKAEFAEYCDNLFSQYKQTRQFKTVSESEVHSLLRDYNRTKNIESEKKLNEAGIFVYSTAASSSTRTTDNGDIFVSTVDISYDSTKKEWIVFAGGDWWDISGISEELDAWWGFYEGATKNVGGLDAMGITFYNTSGPAPTVKSTYAEIGDGTGNFNQYSSPAIMDSSTGAGFLFQDHIICTEVTGLFSYDWAYFGQMFDITIRFDSSFSAFNGKARAFVYHTWNDTSITSIGLTGGADSFGVTVSWQNAGNSWPAFSSGETPF